MGPLEVLVGELVCAIDLEHANDESEAWHGAIGEGLTQRQPIEVSGNSLMTHRGKLEASGEDIGLSGPSWA